MNDDLRWRILKVFKCVEECIPTAVRNRNLGGRDFRKDLRAKPMGGAKS